MRAVASVYASILVIGALGVIAVGVYGHGGVFILFGVVLLVSAVLFFWAQRQGQGSSGDSGGGTRAIRAFLTNLAGSVRLFGLSLIGIGAGVALTMFALMEISRAQHPTGFPFLPAGIFLLACGLAFFGSFLVVVDALYFRRTGQHIR